MLHALKKKQKNKTGVEIIFAQKLLVNLTNNYKEIARLIELNIKFEVEKLKWYFL